MTHLIVSVVSMKKKREISQRIETDGHKFRVKFAVSISGCEPIFKWNYIENIFA